MEHQRATAARAKRSGPGRPCVNHPCGLCGESEASLALQVLCRTVGALGNVGGSATRKIRLSAALYLCDSCAAGGVDTGPLATTQVVQRVRREQGGRP